MAVRFRTTDAYPATGYYEYSVEGETVTSKSKSAISLLAEGLRRRHGLDVVGDPFAYVMEYMCPRLPDGFCTKPSTVKYIRADEVKAKTASLFGARSVTSDEIEKRLSVCVSCPKHVTRGFCMGCSGLIDWIYRGFGGLRPKLPPDQATGVCAVSLELVAASATVDRPAEGGAEYPDTCWRKARV